MSYDLHPMPTALASEVLTHCIAMDSASLGHWRLWGLCDPRVQAMLPGSRAVGTAVTVAIPGMDGTLLHHALDLIRSGDVLVIDRLGDTLHACVGGIVARAAQRRGAAAIVVDGPVADIAELRAIGLPVWATGVTARTTRRLGLGGRLNVPVSIGGAVVAAGDLVLADGDGVVILTPDEIAPALVRCAERREQEARISTGLDGGMRMADMLSPPALRAVAGG